MINDSTISAHLIKENYYFFVLYISFPLELIAFSLLFPVPAVCEWFVLNNRLWVNVLSFLISYILTNKIYTIWLSNSHLVYIYLLKIIISERKKRTEPRGGLLMYTMYALLWIIFILSCVLFLTSICCRFLKSDQFNYKFIQWFTLLKSIYRLPINTF